MMFDPELSSRTVSSNQYLSCIAARLTIIALMILACCVFTPARATESVVRIDLKTASESERISFHNLDPDILAFGDSWVDVLATEQALREFENRGLSYEYLIPDAREYESELRDRGYLDYFHDYQEIVDEIADIVQQFPEIAQLYDIGDGWEKTEGLANRDILAIKISDNVGEFEREEPEVFLMFGIHARELITPEIGMFMIRYLVENYDANPYITNLVDNRQIWIVPTSNPDGLDYAHHVDLWWRKNRRDNLDGTFGVDLNRNFGFKWGYDDYGSSPDPSSETYRGIAPFSEPESQAIRDLAENHSFILSLSYHSFGNWWLYPWGYFGIPPVDIDTFTDIAESCTAYNGYIHGNVASGLIYLTNGGSEDWFYGEETTKYKTFGFAVEVGGFDIGYHPDTSVIEILILDNLDPILYIIDAAEKYSSGPKILHTKRNDTEDIHGPHQVTAFFKTELWPLDATTPTLHYAYGDGDFQSLQMQPADETDLFETHIPGAENPDSCRYYFSAADSIPRLSYKPVDAPENTFVFFAGTDQESPDFSNLSDLKNVISFEAPRTISAMATDNLGLDLESCMLTYEIRGEYNQLPMPFQGYVGVRPVFSCALGPVGAPGDTIRYFCSLMDTAAVPNIGYSDTLDYIYGLEDFESYLSLWDTGTGWQRIQSGSAHSGSWMVTDSPGIDYENNTENILTLLHWLPIESSQRVDLSFWAKYDFEEGNDFVSVEITTNGSDWIPALILTGTDLSWNFHEISLTEITGNADEMLIRFRLVSDADETHMGIYLDDIFVDTNPTTTSNPTARPPLASSFVVEPNPATSQAVFSRTGDLRPDELLIYDISGRLIRSASVGKGQQSIRWDLKDSDQERISSGVYFARLKRSALRTKLIVLK